MKSAPNKPLTLLCGFFLFAAGAFSPGALSAADTMNSAADSAGGATVAQAFLNAEDLLLDGEDWQQSLPVPTPSFFSAAPVAAKPPVVVTVSGLSSRNVAWGVFSQAEGTATRDTDSYLQDRLTELPQCADAAIVPFIWARTFADTQNAITKFVPRLIQVYDAYKNTGRPIYILAHSWGAVIMHDVLHRVAKIRPDLQIDKLVTIGAPLVPRLIAIEIPAAYQVYMNGLPRVVAKPVNLRYWKNLWAKRDVFSNTLQAADVNIQVDAGLGHPELALAGLSVTRPDLGLQIARELALVRNAHAWHKAYYKGFRASLKSLNREVAVEVFESKIAPRESACMDDARL